MSCDIHMLYQRVNVKAKRDNILSEILDTDISELEWDYVDYSFSVCHQNYYWFGRMSEVRGNGPRITHKGLPSDIDNNDFLTSQWWEYNHSFSHIYLDELLDVIWNDEDYERMSTFIYDDIPLMVEYCKNNNIPYSDFRILISYDS